MKQHLVVLSGAGISAESGLPTYRDENGLWKDKELTELMSTGGFYENPKAVLDILNDLRTACYMAQPNGAHKKLAELEKFFEVDIITQNVDDLHERAGSKNILHLHGKLSEVTSSDNRLNRDCIRSYPMNEPIKIGYKAEDGSQLRPNVVLFGEYLTEYSNAVKIIKDADIFLVIGTSLKVFPTSQLLNHTPLELRIKGNAYAINPDKQPNELLTDFNMIQVNACKGMEIFFNQIMRKHIL